MKQNPKAFIFGIIATTVFFALVACPPKVDPGLGDAPAPDIGQDAEAVGESATVVEANSKKTIKHAETWNRKSPGPEAGKIKALQLSNVKEAGKLLEIQKNLNTAQDQIDVLEMAMAQAIEENELLIEERDSANAIIWGIGIAVGFAALVLAVPIFIWGSPKAGMVAGTFGASTLGISLVLQMWSKTFALIVGFGGLACLLVFIVWLIARKGRWITELVRSGERMKHHLEDKWQDQDVRKDITTAQSKDLKVHVARVRVKDQLTKKTLANALAHARGNEQH